MYILNLGNLLLTAINILINHTILFILLNACLSGALLHDIGVTLIQPDGSKLHCLTSGDEYYAWLHDKHGYPIIQSNKDGYYYYADRVGDNLVPSSKRADNSLGRIHNMEKIRKKNKILFFLSAKDPMKGPKTATKKPVNPIVQPQYA